MDDNNRFVLYIILATFVQLIGGMIIGFLVMYIIANPAKDVPLKGIHYEQS